MQMARVTAQIPDELHDAIEEQTNYPDTLKSDVIRNALRAYCYDDLQESA